MRKPSNFQTEYLVIQRTPYQGYGSDRQGSLNIGRVVWLDGELPAKMSSRPITAYVESIGLVQVNSDCLRYQPPIAKRPPARATIGSIAARAANL